MSDTDTTLVQRAASRLHALLDRNGIPTHPLIRNRHLAADLGVSLQESEALLSGLVPWSMGQLAAICQHFGQRPGYFLDPDVDLSLPADTSSVKSDDGGEPIVWRTPGGHKHHAPGHPQLSYFTVMGNSYFGGDRVPTAMVYHPVNDLSTVVPFHVNNVGYVYADESGVKRPVVCTKVTSRHIQLESITDPSLPVLVPLQASAMTLMNAHQVLGRAIGTVSYLPN